MIKFRIDTGRGCLIQKGVPDNVRPVLSKMPKGCVGVSLASAVNTRNKESMNLEYIKCYLPEDPMSNGAPREIRLKRQLVVCSDDAANISKEVYQAKWFYIGFFLFGTFFLRGFVFGVFFPFWRFPPLVRISPPPPTYLSYYKTAQNSL